MLISRRQLIESLLPAAVLTLAGCGVFASQTTDLPIYGTIDQIKNYRKVYVASDNEDSRKRIIKALGKDKNLEIASSHDEAEFFIEYTELSREAVSTDRHIKERQQRSQMRAFVIGNDKRKIVVWSENSSRDTEHFLGMKMYDSGRGESQLTSAFLKALKKARTRK